jgi:hypothetical protein
MLVVPAVRLPFCLPKGIGALLDTLVPVHVHQELPQASPLAA